MALRLRLCLNFSARAPDQKIQEVQVKLLLSTHTKKAQHCTFKRKTLPCKAFTYIHLKEKQQRTEKNEKPSKKISKVKGTGDFEETKDTREDTRYLTRSLYRVLNGTANQLLSFLLIFVVVARGPSKLLPCEAS